MLRTFCETARLGSVTAAAQALGYTQSALSRQLTVLEATVGAKLFDRRARGVSLTEHGRSFLPHAEALLERLDAARRDLQALDELEQGRLRVGAFPTAVAVLIPRAMAAFQAAHPAVSLSLVEGTTRHQLVRLLDGVADVAIVSAFPGQALDERQFQLTHLFDDAMLIGVPRDHPLSGRRSLRLDELAGERWIGADTSDDDRLLGPGQLPLAPSPRPGFVVREWTAKLGLVAAGLGITLVPALAAAAVRPDITLVGLRGQDARRRAIYAATVRGLTQPPATREFLRILELTSNQLQEKYAKAARAADRPQPGTGTQSTAWSAEHALGECSDA
ncbi:MAG TPA: LysR family transcriptional regulator [Streptosporangiaceae bacterium]